MARIQKLNGVILAEDDRPLMGAYGVGDLYEVRITAKASGRSPTWLYVQLTGREIMKLAGMVAVANQVQAVGRAGGKARAKKLSPARRSEIARKAAYARWNNGERL